MQPTISTPQRGDDNGLAVTVGARGECFLDTGNQRRMRAGFDERAVALLAGVAHRLVE
ncbi:Uncharacterised protein [Mycobacterium tuberculosis]|uniref:Uncharacterized protein n=1 Tax=Mycobacterium tuberculosis TaxID=1773 RepID=A0A0U0T1I3_MYCTX|nr:Uncharacterised protein [Mycobacterium tuberculosis]COW24504.1 Uncharacterised protein [Mycobacterium tuberculosis]COW49614.1 Uncharacterised protein [Mycobacterium tuberculosis]COW82098.1 Uncharacterised protein [Mycobacterium tuberculosis]COX14700.1 Uncharacterised protein [Mycobacterium tuberculosis]